MRVKIEKAEEQIPKPSPEQSLEQLLIQDDALRLAKETAIRSKEVEKQDLEELYEKVVLDEISTPEYFYFIGNSVKNEAYSSVLKAISANLGRFTQIQSLQDAELDSGCITFIIILKLLL